MKPVSALLHESHRQVSLTGEQMSLFDADED